MQSSGQTAWAKHFKDKGNFETVAKTAGPLYDAQNPAKQIGKIEQGQKIVYIQTDEYQQKTPVMLESGDIGLFRFDSIQKPLSKSVSGIKLKPQDFPSLKEKEYSVKQLAELLMDDIEERKDLDPKLKQYLIQLTGYYANFQGYSEQSIKKAYHQDMPGMNEIKKDYGEILGQLQCISHGLLKKVNLPVSKSQKILIPWRGNEPLVDYYIIDPKLGKLSVSQKSGSTTNTLKPQDVLMLLESKKLDKKWKSTAEYKLMEAISTETVITGTFQAIHSIEPKLITKKAVEDSRKYSMKNMSSTDYNVSLYQQIISKVPQLKQIKGIPTFGEVFYYSEKYLVGLQKQKLNIGKIFQDATSGMVVYIKYEIKPSQPWGQFDVLQSDLMDPKKIDKIQLRTKNSTKRASDRIGLQV